MDSKSLVALLTIFGIVFPCFVQAIPWRGNTYYYIYYNQFVCVAVFVVLQSTANLLFCEKAHDNNNRTTTNIDVAHERCKTVTS